MFDEVTPKRVWVRLDKDWIVPIHWSWITQLPLVGQDLSITYRAHWANCFCECIQWERVGKYQPCPVRPFYSIKLLSSWEKSNLFDKNFNRKMDFTCNTRKYANAICFLVFTIFINRITLAKQWGKRFCRDIGWRTDRWVKAKLPVQNSVESVLCVRN